MEYNKIAIISDLHANLYMLNAFLDYVEKEKIELIINLGDFVSEGPYPCEVFDKVLEDKRFINIRGYDENKMLGNTIQEEEIGTLAWAKERLGIERLERIRKLPSIKRIKLGNIKILMMHLNGFAEISQKIAHSSNKIIGGDYYDYIFCGGGHLQQLTHVKEPFFNTNIIEPGALIKDENDRGHFVVVQVQNNKPKITFESIVCKEVYTSINQIEAEKEPYLIEEVNLQQDICLHIYNEENNGQSEIFKQEVIKKVLEIGFKNSRYISIGCWANEQEKIKELLYYLKCRRIKMCEKNEQNWYIGEITPEIKEFVQKEIKCYEDKIKWFEISFLQTIYSAKPTYSIYHHGKECLINRMSSRELCNMEEKLKKYEISYEIRE